MLSRLRKLRKKHVPKSKTVTMSFGTPNKNDSHIKLQEVESLGLAGTWDFTGGLTLNGRLYAAYHEHYKVDPEFHFLEGEYINFMELIEQTDSDKAVLEVRFKTNRGQVISAGYSRGIENRKKQGKHRYRSFDDIRVLEIGGSYYKKLSTLKVRFIQNYSHNKIPKTIQVGEATAVISVYAAFTTLTTIDSSEANRLHAATRVQNSIFSMGLETSASASAGFAKASFEASMSASISSQKETSEEIHEEVKQKISASTTRTKEVPEGYIGLELVRVQLMETKKKGDNHPFVWMYPVGESQVVTIPTSSTLPANVYDLTGAVELAMPNVAHRMKRKHGFDCIGN